MAELATLPAPRLPAPQTGAEKAAILLLTLGVEAAARVFRHLNEQEVRQVSEALAPDIIRRVADLQNISDEMLTEVREVLQVQVEGLERVNRGSKLKGPKLAAEILNSADRELETRIFTQLEADVPDVADSIRN